ncbi:MAG: GntR family transcriptional regulator [Roseitalea sp.]|jgi:DNA-binding GntR family transcriptional regulator|nr:GntR family transcriptional regulator [Roseitalea sp.]MBO6720785.1 GntR family transcriptional regulator [Roseitalea sp.]MBO6743932.1 GntR family transcriptional regulator [Roseitalea sp.]
MKNHTSAVERIRSDIEQAIVNGEFVAGQRLTEAALTKKLNVSRGPLREALQLLQNDGLITIQQNKGAVVRELTRQQFAEFFQMRGLFEGFAARRCAKRIDEAGVRDNLLPFLHEATQISRGKQTRPFAEHDAELHTTILRQANNETLESHWRRLRMPAMRLRFLGNPNTVDIVQSAKEHATLIGKILDGDEDGAEDAAHAHVARLNGIVQRMDQDEFDRLFRFAKKP